MYVVSIIKRKKRKKERNIEDQNFVCTEIENRKSTKTRK